MAFLSWLVGENTDDFVSTVNNNIMEQQLPIALEAFSSQIGDAMKPYVKLSRHPDEQIGMTVSKLGGFPYLSYTFTYPCDENDIPLLFIAQINFAESPPLKNYPNTGILQFFISSIGAQECTVRYLPPPESDQLEWVGESDLKLLMEVNAPGRLLDNPIKRPGKLHFELSQAPPNTTNFHFDRLFGNSDWVKNVTLYRTYKQWVRPSCYHHRLGGYGYFVQGDPRRECSYDPSFPEFEILLQLNSDEENFGLRWGDCQEICFFIRPQDLKNLDFSRVRFYLCP
jgi:uncharacterized protein YwqG